MAAKLGIDSKLYRNTGNYNTPTWTAIDAVRDLAINGQWDMTDAPSRASRIKSMAKTILDVSLTTSVKASDTDAGYIALWDASISGTANIDILVLNGSNSTNGARGFRFDALVNGPGEDQAIQNALYDDFTLVPDAFGVNPPKSCVVSGGSPAFTNI
jgi:hypothetical protein